MLRLRLGEAAFISPGAPHATGSDGTGPNRVIEIHAPGGPTSELLIVQQTQLIDRTPTAALRMAGSSRTEYKVVTIRVVEDASDVAAAAAAETIAAAQHAIDARGTANIAPAGGSTPATLYALLADSHREDVDWTRVHCWLGDDRFVPRDDPLSNAALARVQLRLHAESGLPATFTPFATDEALVAGAGPSAAARQYASALSRTLPTVEGMPSFDLILVGIGPDGHILSVFPEHDIDPSGQPTVYDVPAPEAVEPHVARLTINPRLLHVAGRVVLLAVGAGKAAALAAASRRGASGPATWATGPNAVWLLDRAAASRLDPDLVASAMDAVWLKSDPNG